MIPVQSLVSQTPVSNRASGAPLQLKYWIRLPEVKGEFNIFAIDRKRNHLLLSADKNGTVEIFRLGTGEHLQSSRAAGEPHMLAYLPKYDEVWVGDASTRAMVILDPETLTEKARITLPTAPTAGLYDETTDTFLIQNDGVDSKLSYSTLNWISPRTHRIEHQLRFEATNLEGMVIDYPKNRLYINVRDQRDIAVVDMKTHQVIATWEDADFNLNTPIALDTTHNRLFVAGRKPGRFYVLDTNTGKVVQSMDCINIADQMTWDPRDRRIYMTGSQGISIFHQETPDTYSKVGEFPTNGGKISTLDEQSRLFYIAHPSSSLDDAGLEVFSAMP